MTEFELRQRVADIMDSWLGAAKGSEKHREILEIYNTYKPLARGYRVKATDAYCATTVSAAYIRAGIAEYTGTECGANEYINVAKKRGIWVEDDGYVPKVGDAIVYDWQDTGRGDNAGYADHIGIVTRVSGESFVVTEGNASGGRVAQRSMKVDGKNIRGFIAPDYEAIAEIMSLKEDEDMTGEEIYRKLNEYLDTKPVPGWAREELQEAIDRGITDGTNPTRLIPRYQAAIMALRAAKGESAH